MYLVLSQEDQIWSMFWSRFHKRIKTKYVLVLHYRTSFINRRRPTRTFPAAASTSSLHPNPNQFLESPALLRDSNLSALNRFMIASRGQRADHTKIVHVLRESQSSSALELHDNLEITRKRLMVSLRVRISTAISFNLFNVYRTKQFSFRISKLTFPFQFYRTNNNTIQV